MPKRTHPEDQNEVVLLTPCRPNGAKLYYLVAEKPGKCTCPPRPSRDCRHLDALPRKEASK